MAAKSGELLIYTRQQEERVRRTISALTRPLYVWRMAAAKLGGRENSSLRRSAQHSYARAVGEIDGLLKKEYGELGDEHHTLAELYQYRMLYNAIAAALLANQGNQVVKSWRHHDGELCFGGGWFVVAIQTPWGWATNHYKAEYWQLFADVPVAALGPEYDGHTPGVAVWRLGMCLEWDSKDCGDEYCSYKLHTGPCRWGICDGRLPR